MNKLYFKNNLSVLKDLDNDSIDLVYIDPPFNTGKDWGAFNDKWEKGIASYLDFIRPRIEEIHRILKDTGSFYLHCDPTASHYLKVLCDQVFEITNFQNEIVWHHKVWANRASRFQKHHDIIFWYSKSNKYTFNVQYDPLTVSQKHFISKGYEFKTYSGKPYFRICDTNNPNVKEREKDWKKINHNVDGWVYFIDPPIGNPLSTVWYISSPRKNSKESYKYPTQKPIALLERIIKASSNEGDIVLDAFCGSGTTLDAAHKLNRKWIGIDEGQQAIETITKRLAEQHGILHNDDYELIGGIDNLQLPTADNATPQQIKLF